MPTRSWLGSGCCSPVKMRSWASEFARPSRKRPDIQNPGRRVSAAQDSLRFLRSGNTFVLKNSNPHTAVLCFSLRRVYLVSYLTTLAHRRRGNHAGQRDMTILQEDLRYSSGSLLTQLLICRFTAYRRCESFDLDLVAFDAFGFFSQRSKLRYVLGINACLAIGEVDGDFVNDVPVVELPKSCAVSGNRCLVGFNLRLLRLQSLILRLQLGVLLLQFLLILLSLFLGFRDTSVDRLCLLQIVALEPYFLGNKFFVGVVFAIYLNRKSGYERRRRHSLTAERTHILT